MASLYSNQRDKRDENRLGIEQSESSISLHNNENDNSKSIEELDSDCLEHIFRFLPIVDLFKVQRVCKYWNTMSMDVCRRIMRLEMTRNFWGVSSDGNIHIDLSVVAKVLQICGLNLHHIGLSNDEDSYPVECRRIHVESDKKLWILVQNKCPAITSIDFGQSRSPFALKFISNTCKNLTYFKMKKFNLPRNSPLVHETHLCDLFANNEKLKRVDFFDATLTTECLSKLHPTNFVELNIDKCMIHDSKNLIKALKGFKNLQRLRITRCASLQESWLDSVLEALTSISQSLKYLDYYLYNPMCEIIDATYIGKLENLEYLGIAGDSVVGDDLLRVIAKSCVKLRTLQVHNCSMIEDMDFEHVAQHPNLKNLILDNLSKLTDKSLTNMMNIENLEVHRCSDFHSDGVLNLLRNSKTLRSLKMFHCKHINEVQLIEEAEKCSNGNLELIIDSSETSSDYFKSISKIRKSNGKVTKIVQKICSDCFVESLQNSDCDLCCNIVESNF